MSQASGKSLRGNEALFHFFSLFFLIGYGYLFTFIHNQQQEVKETLMQTPSTLKGKSCLLSMMCIPITEVKFYYLYFQF